MARFTLRRLTSSLKTARKFVARLLRAPLPLTVNLPFTLCADSDLACSVLSLSRFASSILPFALLYAWPLASTSLAALAFRGPQVVVQLGVVNARAPL